METIKMKPGLGIPDEPSDNTRTFVLAFMAIIWRRVWITTAIYCEHNNLNVNKSIVLKALKYNIFSQAGIGNTLKPYIIKALTDGFLMPQFYERNIYANRAIKLYKPAYAVIKKKNRHAEIQFLKNYAFKVFNMDSNSVTGVADESKDVLMDINISTGKNETKSMEQSDASSDNSYDNSDEPIGDNLSGYNSDEPTGYNSDEPIGDNSDEPTGYISDEPTGYNSDEPIGDNLSGYISDNLTWDNLSGYNSDEPIEEHRSVDMDRCGCKLCELVDSWDINLALVYSNDLFRNVILKGLMTALDNTGY